MADFFSDEDVFGPNPAAPTLQPGPRPAPARPMQPTPLDPSVGVQPQPQRPDYRRTGRQRVAPAAQPGPQYLSDADVFGGEPPSGPYARGYSVDPLFGPVLPTNAPPRAPEPITSFVRPNYFTPFGLPATRPAFVPPTFEDALRGGVGATGEAFRNLLTNPRETLGRAGKEFTSLFDLGTTGVMQAVGTVFGETMGRIVAGAKGASEEDTRAFGKEFGAMVADHPALNQPLSRLYGWAIKQPGVSSVDQAMEKVTELIEEGDEAAVKKTGGWVRPGDISLLTNAAFAGLGGNYLGGRKFFENYRRRAKPGEQERIEPTFDPGPRYIETPTGRILDPNAPTPRPGHRMPGGEVVSTADVAARAAGVPETVTAKQAKADVAARRKQTREAFAEDPQYGDYLRNFAEEEAIARERGVPLTAPGGLPYSGPRAPRTGLRGVVEEPGLPEARPQAVETGTTPLDTALAKVRAGQRFLLTPEERVALRGPESSFGRQRFDQGHSTQRFMSTVARLGLGAALAAYAYNENDQLSALAGLAAATISIGPKGFTIGDVLKHSGYTTGVLEALPHNKEFITAKDLGRALGSQGITQAEKKIFLDVLSGRKEISAFELMAAVGDKFEKQHFEPVEVRGPGAFDDFGLRRIGRREPINEVREMNIQDRDLAQREYDRLRTEAGHDPTTHILQSPDPVPHYRGHFGRFPRAFAHVRSFSENGIRYISELQSDVMQKLKIRPSTEIAAERPQVERAENAVKETSNVVYGLRPERRLEAIERFEQGLSPEELSEAKKRLGKTLYEQADPRLVDSDQWRAAYDAGRFTAIYDSLRKSLDTAKDAQRGALDEAFKKAFDPEKSIWGDKVTELHSKQVGRGIPSETMAEVGVNFPKRLIREAVALFPGQRLRFPTADTVAKVEGWTDNNSFMRQFHQNRLNNALDYARQYGLETERWTIDRIKRAREDLKALEKPDFGPRQGIYNRYAGEFDRFLRSEFKAKPVTDHLGHTWLEVEPQAPGRIRMMGKTTPEALIALGLGTTAGLALYNQPDVKKALGKMDLGTLMAVALGIGTLATAKGSRGGKLSLERQRGQLGEPGDPTGKLSLGSLLRDEDLTLKAFESLSPRAHTFTRKQIEAQIARQDIVKAEKDLLLEALGNKQEISAVELVTPFLKRAREHALYKTETSQYNEYGIDRLGRTTDQYSRGLQHWVPDNATPEEIARIQAQADASVVEGHTTLFKLPDALNLENHFGDSRYFAHDRHFTDHAGIDHVIETQSDIAQKQSVLPDTVIEEGRAKIRAAQNIHNAVAQAESQFRWTSTPTIGQINHFESLFPHDLLQLKERMGQMLWNWVDRSRFPPEIQSAAQSGDKIAVYNFAKEQYEKLLRAGTDTLAMDDFHSAFSSGMRNEVYTLGDALSKAQEAAKTGIPESYAPMVKNWFKRIVRERVAESTEGGRPVRYATADTVAKGEGWPEHHQIDPETLQNAQDTLANARAGLARAEAAGNRHDIIIERNEVAFWEQHIRDQLAHNDPSIAIPNILEAYKQRLQGEANTPEDVAKIPKQLETAKSSMEVARKAGHIFNNPDHANIYARYAREINPWIEREFKARPYTDPLGHTWLEIPPRPRGRVQMYGRASTRDMAALAAFTGGALAMHAYAEDPNLVKDVAAGLLASVATRASPRSLLGAARNALGARPLESIGLAANAREQNIRLAGLDTVNTVRKVSEFVPDEAGRERVNEALDTGKTAALTPKERKAYDILREEYNRLGKLGLDEGTLKAVRANYATHLWGSEATFLDRLLRGATTYGTSANTPYALHRSFATLAEGEKAGLKARTKDAAAVYSIYANSLMTAVENGRLLKTIEGQKAANGEPLITQTKDAPREYVAIDNPQLRGKAVHPEIASQMRFIFENPSAAGVGSVLETIADVTKRSAVAGSFFHMKALMDVLTAAVPAKAEYFAGAGLGAGAGAAISALADQEHMGRDAAVGAMVGFSGKRMAGYVTGRNAMLKQLREQGSTSDYIKRAVKSGLTFGTEKGPLVVDDAGRRFYDAMKIVQQEADRVTSPVGIKGGKAVEAYVKANHWMDEIMWGRAHPGMKLEVWGKTAEMLQENSARRNARNPKERILSREEAESIAADYTNDMFGGLNWTKIAMNSKSQLGRAVAQETLSPKARRNLRIGLFAPDWTISTARAALSALDKDLVNPLKWGRVTQGMFQPITRGDLARQYIARSALYYLVIGDAINFSMSGHHLWENDDKTGWSFIDWGDGRRMQFSKHIMEVPHWLEKPVKQGIAKLGYVPKEVLNQGFGTEYLAPQTGKYGQTFAGPSMADTSLIGRAGHALGGAFTPIPFQSNDFESFAWGMAGMPIYGKTKEQLEEMKQRRRDKRERKYLFEKE